MKEVEIRFKITYYKMKKGAKTETLPFTETLLKHF